MIAFRYYGGKNSHLSWLLPLLPDDESVEHYVEPFCGSCAVLLNRNPAPCETINDLNQRIANFFIVARDHNRALRLALLRTGYADSELRLSEQPASDPVEDARRLVVRIQLGMFAVGARQRGKTPMRVQSKAEQFRDPPGQFRNATKDFRLIRRRLLNVQIVNRDGISMIEQFDSPNHFFYLDPPYLMETRNAEKVYANEMSDKDHDRLLSVLSGIKGRAALSGYPSEKYDSYFVKLGWNRFEKTVRSTIGKKKTTRTEVVWMNYDPIRQDLFAEQIRQND